MNNNVTFIQSPREVLDYTFDFTSWLNSLSIIEQVQTEVVPSTNPNADMEIAFVEFDSTKVRVIVKGGGVGTKNKIRCTITTSTGLVKESHIFVTVQDN